MSPDSHRRTSATRSDPTTDPAGTVRVHPDDGLDDPTARRVIKTAGGRWYALTHPHPAVIPEEPEDPIGWPSQSLTQLALVLSGASRADPRRPRHDRTASVHPHLPAQRGEVADRTATPSFWEVAKAYCRAFIRTDERLKEHERRTGRHNR